MLKKRTRVHLWTLLRTVKLKQFVFSFYSRRRKDPTPPHLLPSREVTLDNNRGLKKGYKRGIREKEGERGPID
jgi:hypothetical protein